MLDYSILIFVLALFYILKNYYKILEINERATFQEIKKAYKDLALKYHPDRNSHAYAKVIFQEVNEAYQILSDEIKRKNYDIQLRAFIRRAYYRTSYPSDFSSPYTPPKPNYNKRAKTAPPSDKVILKHYFLPSKIVNLMTFLLSICFFIDYFLPSKTLNDRAVEVNYGVVNHTITTHLGNHFLVDNNELEQIKNNPEIIIYISPIYSIKKEIGSKAFSSINQKVAPSFFNFFLFFPITIFIFSVLGMYFWKDITWSFNFGLANAILILIVWFLYELIN